MMAAARQIRKLARRDRRAARGLAAGLAAGLALLLLLLPPTAPAAEPDCEIVIGSCHHAPLSTADGRGIIDRIAIEAFHRVGKRACISALPCERSLLNADSGVIDGDLLRVREVIGPGYPNLVGVPELLYSLPMSCFTTRRDLVVDDFGDLQSLRVGYILGWKILEAKVKAGEVLRVRGPEQLFPLLVEGKADTVIYERLTGQRIAQDLGLQEVRAIEPPLLVTPQYLTLHQRHRALVEPLAAALRAMKADGGYDQAFRAAGVAPPAGR